VQDTHAINVVNSNCYSQLTEYSKEKKTPISVFFRLYPCIKPNSIGPEGVSWEKTQVLHRIDKV
jgi:hypothetical protein